MKLQLILRKTEYYSLFLVVIGVLFVIAGTFFIPNRTGLDPSFLVYLFLFLTAFIAEYLDSTFGFGFGIMMMPFLQYSGLNFADTVTTVLVSEMVTGFTSSVLHYRQRNVDFTGQEYKDILYFLLLPAFFSVIVYQIVALFKPDFFTRMIPKVRYMVLMLGILFVVALVLITFIKKRKRRALFERSPYRAGLIPVMILAAFSKSLAAGGFGVLLMPAQLLVGVGEKRSVVVTSFCEGFVCFASLLFIIFLGGTIQTEYLTVVLIGALGGVALSVLTFKRIEDRFIRLVAIIFALLSVVLIIVKI